MHPLPVEEENQREGPGPVAVPELRKPIAAGLSPDSPDVATFPARGSSIFLC